MENTIDGVIVTTKQRNFRILASVFFFFADLWLLALMLLMTIRGINVRMAGVYIDYSTFFLFMAYLSLAISMFMRMRSLLLEQVSSARALSLSIVFMCVFIVVLPLGGLIVLPSSYENPAYVPMLLVMIAGAFLMTSGVVFSLRLDAAVDGLGLFTHKLLRFFQNMSRYAMLPLAVFFFFALGMYYLDMFTYGLHNPFADRDRAYAAWYNAHIEEYWRTKDLDFMCDSRINSNVSGCIYNLLANQLASEEGRTMLTRGYFQSNRDKYCITAKYSELCAQQLQLAMTTICRNVGGSDCGFDEKKNISNTSSIQGSTYTYLPERLSTDQFLTNISHCASSTIAVQSYTSISGQIGNTQSGQLQVIMQASAGQGGQQTSSYVGYLGSKGYRARISLDIPDNYLSSRATFYALMRNDMSFEDYRNPKSYIVASNDIVATTTPILFSVCVR